MAFYDCNEENPDLYFLQMEGCFMSGYNMQSRKDLMDVFNRAHLVLRHYARGYYPTAPTGLTSMPVNRMFFPLKNPDGPMNFIEDSFRRYPLIPGNMYFVPAFLPARFQLDGRLFFLSIQTNLEIFPGVELFSGCPRMLEVPIKKERAELLRYFDSERSELYPNALKAGFRVFSLLTDMLDHYEPEDFWKPLALRKYAALTDYLNRNGSAMTSVSDLAEEMKMTRENFTRHFTSDTGISPKQLIDRFVTRRCLNLIQQGFPFKEIAARMNFRDVFAFSRYFKRNMKVCPSDWRDKWNFGTPQDYPAKFHTH